MAEFYNKGCGKCIRLDERNGYMLIAAVERNEYIIAPSPVERTGAGHGAATIKTFLRQWLNTKAERNLNRR